MVRHRAAVLQKLQHRCAAVVVSVALGAA